MRHVAALGVVAVLLASAFSLLRAQESGEEARRAHAFGSLSPHLVATFEFRSAATADGTYAFLRLRPDTGETWRLDGKKWTPIAEPGLPGGGLYDLMIQSAAHDWTVLRVDRASGRAWRLDGNQTWAVVEEPAPPPP